MTYAKECEPRDEGAIERRFRVPFKTRVRSRDRSRTSWTRTIHTRRIFSDYAKNRGSSQIQFNGERRRFLITDIVRFPVALQVLDDRGFARRLLQPRRRFSSSSRPRDPRRVSRPARQQETHRGQYNCHRRPRCLRVQSVEILLSPLDASLGRNRDAEAYARNATSTRRRAGSREDPCLSIIARAGNVTSIGERAVN